MELARTALISPVTAPAIARCGRCPGNARCWPGPSKQLHRQRAAGPTLFSTRMVWPLTNFSVSSVSAPMPRATYRSTVPPGDADDVVDALGGLPGACAWARRPAGSCRREAATIRRFMSSPWAMGVGRRPPCLRWEEQSSTQRGHAAGAEVVRQHGAREGAVVAGLIRGLQRSRIRSIASARVGACTISLPSSE